MYATPPLQQNTTSVIIGSSHLRNINISQIDPTNTTAMISHPGGRFSDRLINTGPHPQITRVILLFSTNTTRQINIGHETPTQTLAHVRRMLREINSIYPNAHTQIIEAFNSPDTHISSTSSFNRQLHDDNINTIAIDNLHQTLDFRQKDKVHLTKSGTQKLISFLRTTLNTPIAVRPQTPRRPPPRPQNTARTPVNLPPLSQPSHSNEQERSLSRHTWHTVLRRHKTGPAVFKTTPGKENDFLHYIHSNVTSYVINALLSLF